MSSPLFFPSSLDPRFHHHHRILYLPPTAPKPSSSGSNITTTTKRSKEREKDFNVHDPSHHHALCDSFLQEVVIYLGLHARFDRS
ncbi:hypothetical protein CR513_33107, partial [Mucuna pruriens]